VVTAGDRVVHGAHVVIAVPPSPLRGVTFDPPLPAALQAAIDGLDLGPAVKVTTQYRSPFWRAEGRSGFSLSDLTYRVSWDATDSYAAPSGLLSSFTTADNGVHLAAMADADRIAFVQGELEQVYSGAAAQQAGPVATMAWTREPFTGGGYAAYRPGQLSAFWGPLREGTDRLHFAGEHTEALAGYMESAVRSGHRVARQLGKPS
jgi:monoamine oxidase